MESKSEQPNKPTTPPETDVIKKKEEKVPSPPDEDVEVKTEVASPPPAASAESLSVKAEMKPPTPPTPPTPPPVVETPKVETKMPTPTPPPVEMEQPTIEFDLSTEPAEPTFTTTAQTQWQQIGKQMAELLDRLPDSVGNFYRDYQRPLTVVGGIVAIIIALKLLSGVLDTFNEIPFFEPFFQLIGIIYSAWFIYRYLLNAGSRQELWQIIDDYKAQVFGSKKQ